MKINEPRPDQTFASYFDENFMTMVNKYVPLVMLVVYPILISFTAYSLRVYAHLSIFETAVVISLSLITMGVFRTYGRVKQLQAIIARTSK